MGLLPKMCIWSSLPELPLPTLGNADARCGQGPRRKEPSTTRPCSINRVPSPPARIYLSLTSPDLKCVVQAATGVVCSNDDFAARGKVSFIPCHAVYSGIQSRDSLVKRTQVQEDGLDATGTGQACAVSPNATEGQRDALKQYANRQPEMLPSMQCTA